MKKLVIDNIIFSLQKSGGVSVVWSEFLKRLLLEDNITYSFIEYKNAQLNICREEINIPDSLLTVYRVCVLKIIRYFSVYVSCSNLFIFHSSYYRLCKNSNAINIMTVHDFTYEYYKTGIKKILHSWQKKRAIHRADFVICISENTKKDLFKFIPTVDKKKIRVIYNGVSNEYKPILNINDKDIPFAKKSFILFVGSRAAYKNFEISAQAIAHSNYNFVIVGDCLTKREDKLLNFLFKGNNRYKSIGRVSNKILNILYNEAFALLYPSSYEGFGIPVLEAQKSGCPVIAYNASSIPEIIGRSPLLLNTLSVDEILNCLESLLDEKKRTYIISEGIKNAQKYSWDNMYTSLLDLYDYAWSLRYNVTK